MIEKKKIKRIVAGILCLALVWGLLPAAALADGETPVPEQTTASETEPADPAGEAADLKESSDAAAPEEIPSGEEPADKVRVEVEKTPAETEVLGC